MSFEPSDLQEPVTSTLARKLAAALIPIVAAVPVTVAVVGDSKSKSPSAAEMNAMLGAEMQEETALEGAAPDDLSSVAGLPVDQTAPAGPTPLEQDESGAETLDTPPESENEEAAPADLVDTSLEDSDLMDSTEDGLPAPKNDSNASDSPETEVPGNTPDASLAEENVAPESYEVAPGDTLYGIGQKYGLGANEIAEANDIPIDKPIIPGQVLDIPDEGEFEGSSLPGEDTLPPSDGMAPQADTFAIDDESFAPPAGPIAMDTLPYEENYDYDPGFSPPADPTYIPPSIPAENLPVDEPLAVPTQERKRFGWGKSSKQAKPQAKYCIAYVVSREDTLESIAFSHSTTEEIIKAMNHSTVITPGQVIMIPVDGIMTPCQ